MRLPVTPDPRRLRELNTRASGRRSAILSDHLRRRALAAGLLALTTWQGGCSKPQVWARPVLTAAARDADRTDSRPATAADAGGQPRKQPADAASSTAPTSGSDDAEARGSFEAVSRALGRPGVYKTPGVYVVTVPRDDLLLSIEGMEVPTAAGIESVFHFYYCPCGKTNVVGQLCVLDHEQNDVIDALRAGKIEVVSMAPMLLHARNAPTAIRFFAEGKPEAIGGALREALRWTGKERMAPAAE